MRTNLKEQINMLKLVVYDRLVQWRHPESDDIAEPFHHPGISLPLELLTYGTINV